MEQLEGTNHQKKKPEKKGALLLVPSFSKKNLQDDQELEAALALFLEDIKAVPSIINLLKSEKKVLKELVQALQSLEAAQLHVIADVMMQMTTIFRLAITETLSLNDEEKQTNPQRENPIADRAILRDIIHHLIFIRLPEELLKTKTPQHKAQGKLIKL